MQERHGAGRDGENVTFLAPPEPDADTVKHELWNQVIGGYQEAGISRSEVARRIGISHGSLANLENRGVESVRVGTLERYLNRLTGWAEAITDAATSRSGRREPRLTGVRDPEVEREMADALIINFDRPLYETLTAEGGDGAYIHPEDFVERQAAYLRERGVADFDLTTYRDRIAGPRLDRLLASSARETMDGVPLSPLLSRHLVASASIVRAIQRQLSIHDQLPE